MPSVKQFEYMSLSTPFSIGHMNMYEMAEHSYKQIIQLFEMIESEKEQDYYASVEIPNDDDHWYIFKKGNKFILENGRTDGSENMELEPIDFYNWCFAKAPYFGMIGRGYHETK